MNILMESVKYKQLITYVSILQNVLQNNSNLEIFGV